MRGKNEGMTEHNDAWVEGKVKEFDAIPMILGIGDGNRMIVKSFISRLLSEARQEGFNLGIDKKFQDDRAQKSYERGLKEGSRAALEKLEKALPEEIKIDSNHNHAEVYEIEMRNEIYEEFRALIQAQLTDLS